MARGGSSWRRPSTGFPLSCTRACAWRSSRRGSRETASTWSSASQLVALSGVSDLDAAEGLRGRYLLARREDLPADVELMDAETMVGRTVTDASAGELGRVAEVIRTPAHDVWAIDTGAGELLLPVVDAIGATLAADGEVAVSVPAHLLEELRRGDSEGDEA